MYKAINPVDQIKIGLGISLLAVALLMALTGCVGYVEPGYGGVVVVPEPHVYFWGGGYGGHDWHGYSHRGYESRGRR